MRLENNKWWWSLSDWKAQSAVTADAEGSKHALDYWSQSTGFKANYVVLGCGSHLFVHTQYVKARLFPKSTMKTLYQPEGSESWCCHVSHNIKGGLCFLVWKVKPACFIMTPLHGSACSHDPLWLISITQAVGWRISICHQRDIYTLQWACVCVWTVEERACSTERSAGSLNSDPSSCKVTVLCTAALHLSPNTAPSYILLRQLFLVNHCHAVVKTRVQVCKLS